MANPTVGRSIFDAIEAEYEQARNSVMFLTGSQSIGHRFPIFRERFDRKRADLDRINRLQVALLRQDRDCIVGTALHVPLLQTMNAISAGLGWTGKKTRETSRREHTSPF